MKRWVAPLTFALCLFSAPAKADGLLWFLLGAASSHHSQTTVTEYKDKTSLEIDSIEDRLEQERFRASGDSIKWDIRGFDENKEALISHFRNKGFDVKIVGSDLVIETGFLSSQKKNEEITAQIMDEHMRVAKKAGKFALVLLLVVSFFISLFNLLFSEDPVSRTFREAIQKTWKKTKKPSNQDKNNK